jgi:hypothetical protein
LALAAARKKPLLRNGGAAVVSASKSPKLGERVIAVQKIVL